MASKKYRKSLFIFRRDLRLDDNSGLINACKQSDEVIPSFFFYNDLLDPSSAKFRPNLIQFMYESLVDLSVQLGNKGSRLNVFYGNSLLNEFEKVIKEHEIDAVFVNEDYTLYSKRRDIALMKICKDNNKDFHSFSDYLLTRPGDVLTKENKPYKVFTPFFKASSLLKINKPAKNNFKNYKYLQNNNKDLTPLTRLFVENEFLAQKGGRKEALIRLKTIKKLNDYKEIRNLPYIDGTTCLSAHIKFGTVSVREIYWNIREHLGAESQLITELFWRDFYAHLAYFFPHVFGNSFIPKYGDIEWENDKQKFKAWCNGATGFPIVDAGMRQLNKTGWMHNRVRMIVASFLTKDLHIDWKWGEKYFASKLVDYDPCSNNGGWQWAASTGADAQPYFRIFNPWRQQERFDKDAEYIKRWVPELKDLLPVEIHKLENGSLFSLDYPTPIIDHKVEALKAKDLYKKI